VERRRAEFPLWGGDLRIRAFLDGEFASAIATVNETSAAPVLLELKPCTSLFGRLELPFSSENARLFVLPTMRRRIGRRGRASKEAGLKKEGVTVPVTAGGFRLVGLPAGPYLFGVAIGDSPIARTWEVEVKEGLNDVT